MPNTTELHSLIDRVEQAAAAERNRRRGKKAPAIGVDTEDPIIWAILFGFDANRYFSDPQFWNCERARYLGEAVGTTTWIADDWINVPFISPAMFRDFVLPHYLEIERQHGAIGGIHSCGNQTPVQQYLLQIRSLQRFEVSPWTDLLQTLLNVPPDKALGISLHPNDVLASSPAEMRTRLEFIADSCRGRRIGVGTSGLTPIYADPNEFNRRIDTWVGIAREVFGQ